MSAKKSLEAVRILEKAALIIPVITALVLGACQKLDSAASPTVVSETPELPAVTETVKIETPTPTPTPEVKYEKVTDPAEIDRMSTLTLDDLKPGSAFSKWEKAQAEKIEVLLEDKNVLDLVARSPTSDGTTLLVPRHIEKDGTVPSTEFLSLYKIKLDSLGFPGVEGYIATYVQEDKNGDKIRLHFLLGESGLKILQEQGIFADKRRYYFQPINKFGATTSDKLLLQGKPGSKEDIRPLGKTVYDLQGLSPDEMKEIFERIAETDAWGDDKETLESIVLLGGNVWYVVR